MAVPCDYRRVREIMWSDKHYGLRGLPDFYGYPLLVKVMKTSSDPDQRSFNKGDVLRIDGEEGQRRMIALDSRGSHWSFPLHIGTKFEVPDKKGNITTRYMSEMAESGKLPKKFSFAQRDELQVKISGEDKASAAHIIAGEYKPKEIIKIRIYKANKIEEDDIDPRVLFLPAYLDLELVIATKLACESDDFWEDYMIAMTRDLLAKVNLNMHRGKSEIQVYYSLEKPKKSKRTTNIYEEQKPTVSVLIGTRSIMRTRKASKKRSSEDGRSLSLASMGSLGTVSTFTSEETTIDDGPKKSVLEILSEKTEKDETEMTEEEKKREKHRRMMLAMLAREEEEELENAAKEGGAERRGDEVDGDGDDISENDSSSISTSISQGSELSWQGSESQAGPTSNEDELNRLPSPGDGSAHPDVSPGTVGEMSSTGTTPKIPPRIRPGGNQPLMSPPPDANGLTSGATAEYSPSLNQPKTPLAPPPRPKHRPEIPGPKPQAGPKPSVPAPVAPKPMGPKPVGPTPVGPKSQPVKRPRPPPRPVPRGYPSVGGGHAANTDTRFTHIRDFPSDLAGLTIDDMCTALRFLNLGKYEGSIREHSIDGDMAKVLSEDDLKDELGMSGLELKKLSRFIHNNWRPT